MPLKMILPKGGEKDIRLSCTQVDKFQRSPQEWFDEYILKLSKVPQTKPMCVGSAFDSYCKHKLAVDLFGPNHPETLEMAKQFENSVEEVNRDFARVAGAYCLKKYMECGRYDQLLKFLATQDEVHFESLIEVPVGVIVADVDRVASKVVGKACLKEGTGRPETVNFIMKPDCFSQAGGVYTILDWKVNGFCSKDGGKPEKGYYRGPNGPNPKGHDPMLPLPTKWKDQLHTYSYGVLMKHGVIPLGSRLDADIPIVSVSIDQLCCIPKADKFSDVSKNIDVYEYLSANNINEFTDMHNRLSYMVSCLMSGWWDPNKGDYFEVEAWGRGRASIDPTMLAMARPR